MFSTSKLLLTTYRAVCIVFYSLRKKLNYLCWTELMLVKFYFLYFSCIEVPQYAINIRNTVFCLLSQHI